MCAHHFDPDDPGIERKDQRGNRAALGDLQVEHSKKDALPKIWPGYPAYVSKTIPKRRSSTSLADARAEKEKISTLERNQVSSIPELREKMKQIPSFVHEVLDDGGNLVYFSLVTSPIPHIRFSIVVSPDMAFSGHGFAKNIKYVARTIFNLGATYYAAELNGQIHASRKRLR